MKTLDDVRNELREQEEIEVIDLLDITSSDLVDRFDDRVEDYFEDEYEDYDELDNEGLFDDEYNPSYDE